MPTSYTLCPPSEAPLNSEESLLLDVRTPAEYAEAHITGSFLTPLHELDPSHIAQLASQKKSCLLICQSGTRARQAAKILCALPDMPPLQVLEGGIHAWRAAGHPLILGKRTISMERQVRIAAGSLVLLGCILSYSVHSAWIALSAFVGAGLVFAGVSDTCGMALLLARMPWNQARSCKSAQSDA